MIDLIKPYPGESEESYIKRKAYCIRILRARYNDGERIVKNCAHIGIPITEADKKEIDAFWAQYMTPRQRDVLIDYRYYNIFKGLQKEGEKLSYYIPDTFYYVFVDDYFTNPQDSKPCDDKNLYDLMFHDIPQPRTIFRKVDHMLLDYNYKKISLKEALDKSRDEDEVVLKICKYSNGGHGVMFWNSAVDSDEKLIEFLDRSKNIICQEVIKQHSALSILNPTSVNTIRLFTFVFNGEVYLLSSFVRFGVKGSRVDNNHSGGLGCGIDKDGRLKTAVYDVDANRYDYRPEGKSLDEIVIPNYDKCVQMAKDLAYRFASVTHMIAWDFAIDENGNPLFIEFGLTWGGLNFHQMCNGPVFGDMTEDVLKEVFANSFTLNSIIKSL